MILNTRLKYVLPLLLLGACTNNEESERSPAPLYPQPNTLKENSAERYTFNEVTGAAIEAVITDSGDSLMTGVPIPSIGMIIDPNTVSQPKVVPFGAPDSSINAHPNVHKIPDELVIIPIIKDSLVSIKLGENVKRGNISPVFYSNGDTVQSGISIPVDGKSVASFQPHPTKAFAPRFKENIINNMQYLDVDQGMASSYVLSIIEDKSGNLWFGTDGGGVSKYNGESFKNFTEKEGLPNNVVHAILDDKSGNLWFATNGGVSMYDGDSFTHFTEKEGLSNNHVYSILEDKNGNLWFGTKGGGVCKYDGDSFTHFTKNEGLSNNFILCMAEAENGDLWIGTSGGGACMFDGESFTHFTKKEGLTSNSIVSLLVDKAGNVWLGTYGGGACCYNGESFTHYTVNEGLSNNFVFSIIEDRVGNIWLGTNGGGMNMYDGESFTHYGENEGLSNNHVYSIMEDKTGNLWFGTNGGGVSLHKRESFSHFTKREGLADNIVFSIEEGKSGNMWFGTDGAGVSMYDGESFTHITEKEGLSNNYVYSILEDSKGRLWFGTDGEGASMFDGESFTYFTENEGLSNNVVHAITEDAKGNIWFGTDGGGASMYNGQFFTHFTEAENLSHNIVFSIVEDRSGNLWFGTDGGGVSRYNGDTFTHFTEKEGLSNNIVFSILEDRRGNLWFGTYGGGISMYDGESFTHFTEREGLSNNIVWSLQEDVYGNIWASTENGLNELVPQIDTSVEVPKENRDHFSINRFLKKDGLKGVDYFDNSAYLDSKNRLWWGSGKSLTLLDRNKFTTAFFPPSVHLRQLDINEQFIDYRNITDSLGGAMDFVGTQKFENYPLGLELPYDKNHLTFHFSAIDWKAPHKIQYSYLMEGLNDGWSAPSSEAKADYRNLPHGNYTFKVRAIGESGEWSEAFEYEFKIHPPWWHTWWARVLYLLAGVIMFIGLVRLRTAKLKQRQKELETEVDNATKVIKEQKEVVEEAHKEITDSINYAERIQRSFLATKELLDANLQEYFVFFQPKEAVSGDFYWATVLPNGRFAVINADSTGHGVPGSIMSILNISSIERAVENGFENPADIFNETRKTIIERLKKDGSAEGGKDGMDASLISINSENNSLQYVAANNPIWILRNTELIEIKGEKMPVGKHDFDQNPFIGGEIPLEKGDIIYTLTDGYQDQFGGEKGKKFKVKPLKELLILHAHLPMKEQYTLIARTFNEWKGNSEQVDDVCVIGVKI